MQPVYVLGTNAWAAGICDVFDVRGSLMILRQRHIFTVCPLLAPQTLSPTSHSLVLMFRAPITALARCFQTTPLAIDYFSLLQLKHWPLKVLWGGEFADEYSSTKISTVSYWMF